MGLFPKFTEAEEGQKALDIKVELPAPAVEKDTPCYRNGWEKVYPVKGQAYWQKGNLRAPATPWPQASTQSPEQRQDIQNMLSGSVALYMEEHPEVEGSKQPGPSQTGKDTGASGLPY